MYNIIVQVRIENRNVQGSAKKWAPGCVNAAGKPGRAKEAT